MADWYLPGYKSGGPVRSLQNIVHTLGDHYELRVITRDHDFGDAESYGGIRTNCWTKVGKAQVWYSSRFSVRSVRKCVKEVGPDVIYLNSFFSALSRIIFVLRYFHLLRKNVIVLAPRGEFSPGALNLKPLRKRLYLLLCRKLCLARGVLWQASSDMEAKQIRVVVGMAARIHVAPDLKCESQWQLPRPSLRKVPGSVRFVFLSRISPMKNLEHLLELMTGMSGQVELDIYGPVDDQRQWRRCEQLISRMPPSIRIRYHGHIRNDEVIPTIAQRHFFVLPTLGENFGHAIMEALVASRPVLISDRTPWKDLSAKHAGWDLALDDEAGWKTTLDDCVQMDQFRYDQLCSGARMLAEVWMRHHQNSEPTLGLFQEAVSLRNKRREAQSTN